MADVEFKLEGLDSLLKKLESVSYDVKRKGGRSALRKAAQVVQKSIQTRARALDDPETGRSIADNVAIRWSSRLFKNTGDLGFRVGIQHGAVLPKGGADKQKNAPTPHWRLLEFGTENMRAHPFVRPALADNIAQVTNTFLSAYEKSIDRILKKKSK